MVAIPDAASPADSKVSIGYPIASVVDVSIRIESYRHQLRLVTECPRLSTNSYSIMNQLMSVKGLGVSILYWCCPQCSFMCLKTIICHLKIIIFNFRLIWIAQNLFWSLQAATRFS
jgi:hypothetical protein